MNTNLIISALLITLGAPLLLAQPGTLDDQFNFDGKVMTNIGGKRDQANALAIQPDGKIVVVGMTGNWEFALARFHPDGLLDINFGNNGRVITNLGTWSTIRAVAVQIDGKIIVAGSYEGYDHPHPGTGFILIRYNSDGTLDTGFGAGGQVLLDAGSWGSNIICAGATDIAIQPDGKIVVGGYILFHDVFYDFDFAAARLNKNGTLDNSFGSGGRITTDFYGKNETAASIALQADGKIILVGSRANAYSIDQIIWWDPIIDPLPILNNPGQVDIAIARYHSNGTLDNSFSGDGRLIKDISGYGDVATSVAVQPDGKIIVGGAAFIYPDEDFALLRFLPDGTPDNSFNGDGITTTPLNGRQIAQELALQPDGKIVMAGYSASLDFYNSSIMVQRFLPNGNLDNSFDADGYINIDIDTRSRAHSVAIQNDGKIVLAGTAASTDAFVVIRLNPNGTLHNTPYSGGISFNHFIESTDGIYALLIQPDNKIIAVGSTETDEVTFIIARYHQNGEPDWSFSRSHSYFGGQDAQAYAAVLQSDGKVIAGGTVYSSHLGFALKRYASNGYNDMNFGTLSEVTTFFGSEDASLHALALQSDGKIVAAGYINHGSLQRDFGVVRYLPDGSLDNSFGLGGAGFQLIDFTGGDDIAFAVAIQPDGKILVAGQSWHSGNDDFALARMHPNGNLDNSFGVNGVITTTMGPSDDVAQSIALQPDGKIVIAGYTWQSDLLKNDIALARYLPNGTLDNSFSSDGKVTTDLNMGSNNGGKSVAIESDGKILVGGFMNNDFALTRYLANGNLDLSFGIGGTTTTTFGPTSVDIARCMVIQSDKKILLGGQTSMTGQDFALARYLSGLEVGILDFSTPDYAPFIYPNPIRSEATLEYTLAQDETISIRLLDGQGRIVQTFLEGQQQTAGDYQQRIALPESLPEGWYVLVIAGERGQVGIRIIK